MDSKVFAQTLASSWRHNTLDVLDMLPRQLEEVSHIPQGHSIEDIETNRSVQRRRCLQIDTAKASARPGKVNTIGQ